MMEPSLGTLQRWMLDEITCPATADSSAVAEMLLPSERMSAEERLAIYQQAYWLRLVECLREFFPVLRKVLEEDFDTFAAEYFSQHPPASYSLHHVADKFPDFLASARPPRTDSKLDWADCLIELAQLELAIDQVFDGPGTEAQPSVEFPREMLMDAERWLQTRLFPAPCVRLLAFQFPINDFYTSVREGRFEQFPAPSPSYLALTRREFIVRRVPLHPAEFALLREFCGGASIAEALETVSCEYALQPEQLQSWFASWARLGLLSAAQSD